MFALDKNAVAVAPVLELSVPAQLPDMIYTASQDRGSLLRSKPVLGTNGVFGHTEFSFSKGSLDLCKLPRGVLPYRAATDSRTAKQKVGYFAFGLPAAMYDIF
jgi:hypothetical protein